MRYALSVIALTIFLSALANAQKDKVATKESSQPQSYTLTLVEFRLKLPDDRPATGAGVDIAKDFEKLVAAGNVTTLETVRMSVLESYPSSVLFGRTVAMTTGVVNTVNGKMRNMTDRQIGTNVKVTATPEDDKVLLKLSYQASRIGGEVKEDVTPDIETNTVDTTQLLEIGKRVVVAGTSAAESRYLMVTLSK